MERSLKDDFCGPVWCPKKFNLATFSKLFKVLCNFFDCGDFWFLFAFEKMILKGAFDKYDE